MAYSPNYFFNKISPHVRLSHLEIQTVRKFIRGLFYPTTPIMINCKPNQMVVTFGVYFHGKNFTQNAFLTSFAETIISRWMSTRVRIFVFNVPFHQAKDWITVPKRV